MKHTKNYIRGVFWDYDGTLADTRIKNLNVTRKLVKEISGIHFEQVPALSSLENYSKAIHDSADWHVLYKKHFGLTDEQINDASKYWTEYQQKDNTQIDLFPDIVSVIKSFNNCPQAVVSMNAKDTISSSLEKNGILPYFRMIVGYEEVDIKRQKPNPDGLLYCIDRLSIPDEGVLFYVGDHETDIQCVFNTNIKMKEMGRELKIISIAALYSDGQDTSRWQYRPDYKAFKVNDIMDIVNSF